MIAAIIIYFITDKQRNRLYLSPDIKINTGT